VYGQGNGVVSTLYMVMTLLLTTQTLGPHITLLTRRLSMKNVS